MSADVLAFPSGGPPRHDGHRGSQRAAPAGEIVEVVRLDGAFGEDENAFLHGRFRIPLPLLVPPHGAERAAKRIGEALLRPAIFLTPVRKLHWTPTSTNSLLPKWLYELLAVWQYANMANSQIVYIRRVANDDAPPNRIQELLDAKGMSQAELARLANTTVSSLNKVVKGTRGLDQEWMRRLAPHLGVSPADLLPKDENPGILSDAERDLLDRYRRADRRTREQLDRVTAALLPAEGLDDRAA